MERLTQADRAYAVVSAAARDINNELTIIVNSVAGTIACLEPGHPARPLLLDLQGAAQRCIWKASSLLNYGARHGVKPVPIDMERLMKDPELL